MLRNYLKIALRNLWRNKGYSAINIFGLALGLATCLLITLFVVDEVNYDRHNKKAERIYRVNTDIRINASVFSDKVTPAPMASVLTNDYPQVEQAVRIKGGGNILVKKSNETLVEQHSFFADPALFDIFTIPMIHGDPKTALNQPNTIVISETIALKYFGSTDVTGNTLTVDNTTPCKITGVIKNTPAQSHLHFNFIRSMSSDESSRSDFWLSNNVMTYVLLRPGGDQQMLDSYLRDVAKRYAEPQLVNVTRSNFTDLEEKGDYFKYTTIPLTKIHLYSTLSNEIEPSGSIQYVYIFAVIAIFILVIACVNFMNLSTARSAGRSKEVGVRKVLGSERSGLISQFLTESVLTSFLALFISLLISVFFLRYFNELAGKQIGLSLFSNNWLLPGMVLATFVIGLLAGLYPAFFLSAFEPIKVLKGKVAAGFKGGRLRNFLVVFQFTSAIILIVCTIVIYNQLSFIRNKNLGYSREHVVVLQNAYALASHAQTFKNEVMQIPGVIAGTRSDALPTSTSNDWNNNAFSKDALMSASQTITMADWSIDADYLSTLNMQMAGGRNFSPQMATDSAAILINETAARLLGFEDPLEKTLYDYNSSAKSAEAYKIIGVVKDFNTGSLRYQTEPIVFRLSNTGGRFIFRINGERIPGILRQIEHKYRTVVSEMAGQPFIYSFMDEDFNHIYRSEERTGKIFISFTFFAILIASLGLFGLITYAAEQRTKEIGIRKVLGASVANVTAMLSKDFLSLVLIAIVIAAPIAWFAMNRWLQDFAYRTAIAWWVFAVAAVIALLIAFSTVSYQAIKAAIANPAKSLRSE